MTEFKMIWVIGPFLSKPAGAGLAAVLERNMRLTLSVRKIELWRPTVGVALTMGSPSAHLRDEDYVADTS